MLETDTQEKCQLLEIGTQFVSGQQSGASLTAHIDYEVKYTNVVFD